MVNAIICEFNPFHNGHEYLMRAAKAKTGADFTLCIMSGNFVQRGQPAFCQKHLRAAAAVHCGADLVLQLPTAHTLAGAQVFAGAGVYIASRLGVDTSLCFGSEDGDLTELFKMAEIDSSVLRAGFAKAAQSGASYAAAAMRAYGECSEKGAQMLKKPNNLLSFEYIKAAREQKSDIRLVNIPRRGAHDGAPDGIYASAGYIRAHEDCDNSKYMPRPLSRGIDIQKYEQLLLWTVYSKTAEELEGFADLDEGLSNRVYSAAKSARTVDELYMLIKSKRYTHAKIRRAVTGIIIGNPRGLYKTPPSCLRVLALNDRGRGLLKRLCDSADLPIIIKPRDAEGIADGHFPLECRATDVYDFCSANRQGRGREYLVSPIYVR